MKKGILITLLTAAGLVVTGILIFVITFFAAGGFSGIIRESEYTQGTLQRLEFSADEIDELSIDAASADVVIETSTDGSMTVEYSDIEYVDYFIVDLNGSSLSLTRNIKRNSTGNKADVCVLLPEAYSGSLNIKTSSGDVEINAAVADAAELHSTSGRINIDDFRSRTLFVESTSGRIEVGDGVSTDSIALVCTSGGIDVGSVKAQSLSAESTSGRIELDDADAQAITLKCTSGGISGALAGKAEDYTAEVSIGSGKSSLFPGGAGSRTLNIKTSSGNIDLEFEDPEAEN